MLDWILIRTDDDGRFLGDMPKDDQTVIISSGDTVTTDRYFDEGDGHGRFEFFQNVEAWMPMPKPYWG